MSSSTLPLSASEKKRLAQCAREADGLLGRLLPIDCPGKESTSIIRQLRELLPKLDALTNVPPTLREIITAGPDGAGLGVHRPPASARWPVLRKQMHEAASAWLKSVSRDAATTKVPKATVNMRMADEIQKNPNAMGWTITQWQQHLKCSRAAIQGTATWRSLERCRLTKKAERIKDRHRR
jgi:hypothetical protein